MLKILLATTTLVLATPRPARQDVNAIIDRAVAAWAKVKTVRGEFVQSVTNPITGSSMDSRGRLQQRKPNQLAITFLEPAGDRIVADGKNVWVFLQSAIPGQVIRMSNTQAGAANTDLIGQFLDSPKKKYDITDAGAEEIGGRGTRALVLTAKPGAEAPVLRAKVWVDDRDSLIRQFESTDAAGISRRVRLTSLNVDARVDTGAFTFTVPAGVRVVTP